ncbi:pseudouridylate synthase [Angomonas deanei]|nr:pseudouridylate synthase [Angomonas deanei]|eukprot:EPY35247.1 pseudouridylate synthase [Angomonas deanei]
MDIRGGLFSVTDEHERSGPSQMESPDVLQLTGGVASRHGMSLGATSNHSPADATLEEWEEEEYGDTPVQITDMLRERLMELKGEKLKQERVDTFMPKRLPLCTDAEVKKRKEAERGQQELLALAKRATKKKARFLADLEEEGDGVMKGEESSIRHDGVPEEARLVAKEILHSAENLLPGTSRSPTFQPKNNADLLERAQQTTDAEAETADAVHLLRTLPRAGYCSRREAAAIIASGQVRVNNVVERNPFRLVRAEDDIHVSGHHSRLRFAPPRLWMYHKPANVVVSRNDPLGRALISRHARILGMDHLIPVGSLPMRSHGVLLLTNDGELSRFLENPASNIQRTYLLRVRPAVDPVLAQKLNENGVNINGKQHRNYEFFVNPAMKSRYSLKVKMRGDVMPVSQLMQHLGRKIERGGRVSFGPFALGTLAVGSVREVTVPPFYMNFVSGVWSTFIERDWPYFRRQRVTRLRRLSRYRQLTPGELEELDNFTYEEVRGALSFESQELEAAAETRAAAMLQHNHVPVPSLPPFPGQHHEGDIDTTGDWVLDESIIEDITSV